MTAPAERDESVSEAQNIEALLSELRVFVPPDGFRDGALANDPAVYDTANADFEAFWADVARAVQDVFERTTVADLAARHRKMAPGPVVLSPEQLLSRLN